MDVRSPFFQNIALILAGVMLLNPIVASAAQLTVDAQAGGNTSIGQAGNGVPIVNIATPNGSGLSHNKFTDYNVGQQGLILNNGAQAFVPTQQGGYITGNPNLRGGAAGVILNEVTGSNRSQLKGYTEVAGQAAHVIVANPHGITCDGCGFINTPRATLTTGAPVVNNGRLQGFDVNGGDIAIEGAGLNAGNVDQFDLITRSAQINAEIHAKRLNVIAGRNEVDVATLQATAKADDGSQQPQLAIDSSALGGMYAGAIRLVGTEAGVGVKLAGDMAASAGDIQIDANGQLTTNRMAASNDVTLVAKGVELDADTYAGRNATVTSPGTVQVKESLAAGQRVAVQAAQLDNAGIIEAGVRADGSVSSAGHLQLDGGAVRNAGKLTSHGSLSADLQKLDNQSGAITAAGNTTLKAEQLDNRNGEIVAQGSLTLDNQTLNNQSGSAVAGQALAIKAESADNSAGTLAAGGAIEARVTGVLSNDGGLVEAGSRLDIEADSLSNASGRLRALGSNGESRFAIGAQLNNDDGLLEVGNVALTFDTPAFSNQRGVVRHLGNGGLHLDMEQLGQAGGEFITNSAVSLSAEEWINTSLLQAASLTLDIDRLTQTSTGGLLAVNSLSTSGETWINDGRIETNGNLDLRLSGGYRGNGSLLSQGDVILNAQRVELGTDARVRGGGSVSVSVLGELANAGQVTAGTSLKLAVGEFNNRGSLGAAGDLLVQTSKMHNEGGLIFSGADMTLLGGELTNRRGDIYSLGNLLFAQNDAGDKAKRFSNVSGTVESAGTMTIASGLLENLREDFDIVREKISAHFIYLGCGNCGGSKEASYFDLVEIDRTRGSNDSPQAQLLSGGTMTLHSDSLDNRYSLISAGEDLLIDTQALSNLGAQAADVTTTRWVHLHRVYMSEVRARRAEADAFNARNWIGSSRYNPGDITAELNDFLRRHLWETYLTAGPTYSNQVDYSGILQAAGKVTIEADKELNSSVIRPGFAYVSGGNRVGDTGVGSDIATYITLNPQLPPDLAQKAVDPLSLPGFSLPSGQNGLFSLSVNPDHPYLIETNSAFADLGNFLNSSYLLDQLGYNPDKAQKLLGDGLYEQRLIRDAIVARTGQRFLAGLTSDEAQFRYLMDNAIASKEALQLSVGVGLSADQVAALTHDIVWMEERQVNGQKVLAPVVYLAQAEGRLAPSGALIQGRDLTLISGGGLVNQGTLRATQNLNVTAQQNIANSGLMHADGRLSLLAGESIRNSQGGILKGQDVSLVAVAGDVVNERTVSTHHSTTRNTDRQQSFVDSAARIEAGNDLLVSAGNDIRNIGGAISAGRDASLEAGNDLILGSAEAENRQNKWDRKGHSYQNSITQYGSDVQVGRDLEAVAGRDLLVVGSTVKAGGNIDLGAGGDMTITSAADESHSDYYRKSGGKKVVSQEDHVKQVASVIEAGGNLNAQADGNLVLASSHLKAGNEAYLYAGEQLALIANQNTDYSLYDKKKKGGWGSKETQRDETTTVRNIGSTITTGGNLSLISEGDQLYQKARLESGNNLTLDSGGAITFEAVKDLDQESHEKSSNSVVWTSTKGKGSTDETLYQSQLVAKGDLVIKAVDGLNIDVKEVNQQSVSQTIDAMVKADPDLAWLQEMEQRGDVDWRQVKEIHDSFKYSHSGLGGAAMMVIAIVVAYFTAGAASGLVASAAGAGGAGAGAAAGAAAAGTAAGTAAAGTAAASTSIWAAATATTAAGWANVAATAVISSAASNAAVSTINNRGNLGAVFKDVTSSDSLKGYATSAITAGFTSGVLDSAYGVTGDNVNKVTKGFDLSKANDLAKFGSYLGAQGAVQAVAQTAIQGGSLGGNLQTALTAQMQHLLQAGVFHSVGDFAENRNWAEGGPEKIALHAVMGGLLSEATGGDFKTGALAGGANELLVEQLAGAIKGDKGLELMVSQLIGVAAATATGGDPAKAAELAKNATAYNRQMHPEEVRLIKRQAKQMAIEEGISEDEASRRMAEAFAYYTDKDWRSTISGKEVLIEESTLSNLGKALAPLANRYEAVSDVPQIGERNYTAAETLGLLVRYESSHTDFFDSRINAEHLIGRSSTDWEYQEFYRNNLNYGDGVGLGPQLVGIGKGVGTAVGDTVIGTYELGKGLVTEPLSTSEQIANGIRQAAFQPNEAYANYTQARDDAQIQAALYRLQGNPEAAAKVEAQWETNFALNFAGGGSGALRKLPRSGADVWEAGPIAKGKLEADAPNLDPKPGHGGTSLAGLPEHYREGGSVGSAFNEVGGLPDGYRRVLNTKTGNTEVVSSDGVFYFETADGLRPKAGGNLTGQVEAERRIAGSKGSPEYTDLSQPGGLMATEGGQILKPNGKLTNPTHPLERHGPDVTDTYLKDRAVKELADEGRTGLRTAFNDRAQMESAISKTFAIKKQEIDAWISSNPKTGVPKAFEADPGLGNLGRGFEVSTSGGPVVEIKKSMPKVNLVLMPDGNGGYLIHTAHPL